MLHRTFRRSLTSAALLGACSAVLGLLPVPAAAVCAANPQGSCRIAERSSLTLRNDPVDSKDRLNWKWSKGEPTLAAQLADPTSATDYDLCIYSGAGANLWPGGSATIPASGTLWLPTTKGYKYKDKTYAADGISTAVLRADPLPSRSSAIVKGRGPNLPDPTLGLAAADFPLVVQLVNGDTSFCLQSTFLEIDASRNDATQLKLKNQ